jgi:hypothetical protein
LGEKWSIEEIDLLKQKYPLASKSELKLFPERTYQSLSRFASKHGINKSANFRRRACTDTWTDKECLILQHNFERAGKEMISKLIPNKSYKAIWFGTSN